MSADYLAQISSNKHAYIVLRPHAYLVLRPHAYLVGRPYAYIFLRPRAHILIGKACVETRSLKENNANKAIVKPY